MVDGKNIFQGHRVKIEAVRDVIICGDGFRIGVDHDGFVAQVFQGKNAVHTAVVKLDSLSDPVGS